MQRREFIKLVGGTAAIWPLAARAQQPAPGKWLVGMLIPEDRFLKAIREGLAELGYVEGQNLVIDRRFDERADRLAALAVELVGLKPDIIVAAGTQAALAAQRATRNIPIVMSASNPLGNGLIESLAHPGGNVTGLSMLSPELSGKRVELLHEAAGRPSEIAVLYDPRDPPAVNALKETLDSTRRIDVHVAVVEAGAPEDIAPAFEKIAAARPHALVVLNSFLMSSQLDRIAELALQSKLASIYTEPAFAKAGGLMSYGPNFEKFVKRKATYIDRILKGAKPADLPVEQPTKFELVINLKTAKVLAIAVPSTLLSIADELIE